MEDDAEKQKALETFVDRFSPEFKENGRKFIAAAFEKTAIIKISVESMKGKSYQEGAWK